MVLARHDEHVAGEQRAYVEEADDVIRLDHDVRRGFASSNGAEDTGHSLATLTGPSPPCEGVLYIRSVKPRAVQNPPNPWASTEIEWIGEPPEARLETFEEHAKSILSENTSPDVGMRFSINPYRGCAHACAYCYARPSHQYLGFGAGSDFDRKIVVKLNAPELLRAAFGKKSWRGDSITFSGNTDCYQPLEASYRLTRRLLEVCHDFRNPVHVITKSALVRRDADVLAKLSRDARAGVTLSIPFADVEMARAIEPYAAAPSARFESIRRLRAEGIDVSVNIAPLIPGLNDAQVPEILERAHEAGATSAALLPVRLAAEVLPVFFERLAEAYPNRVNKVRSGLLQIRRGKLDESGFGDRMTGDGPRWEAIRLLFRAQCQRLGLGTYHVEMDGVPLEPSREDSRGGDAEETTTFRRPTAQRSLFE